MIPHLKTDRIALVIDNKSFSYEEVEALINQTTINKLEEDIKFLPAESNIDFIVNFLTCLRQNIPCCVYDQTIPTKNIMLLKEDIKKYGKHPDCQLILLTSGSSGISKAVQLSQQNILANIESISECLEFSKINSQVIFLPLFYSFGLIGQLLVGLYNTKTTFIVDHLIKIKQTINENNINMISGVPTHLKTILNFLSPAPKSISHIVSAGAPLSLSLRKDLTNHFPKATIYNNYGQTEIGPRALCINSNHPKFFSDVTGSAVKGIQTKIKDGELQITGPQIMLGYIKPDSQKIRNKWLCTGDMAYIENELITIKGRKDDLINVAGERVSLVELEEKINQVTIRQDCIAISIPNELYENQVHIFFEKTLPSQKKLKKVNESLKINIQLDHFHSEKKYPYLSNGKINKTELKKIVMNSTSQKA